MRKGIAIVAVAATVAGATYLVRGGLDARTGRPPVAAADVAEIAPDAGGDRSRRRELDRLITHYEGQVGIVPSTLDLTFLGRLYSERARLTGQVDDYLRAERALGRAIDISPADVEARRLLAGVRFSAHRFSEALVLAEGLLRDDPLDVGALAVAGDARLELGDYPGAAAAYGRLARALPGVAGVLVRRARLAFLTGEVELARSLALAAETSAADGGLGGADLAWYRSFRAQLELDAGRYEEARRLWASSIRLAPELPGARAGIARALLALGQVDDAIRHLERAVELLPDPASVATLGDAYAVRGDRRLAEAQYETVEAIATIGRASRQVYDRALVTFFADHDRDLDRALRMAEAEIAVREDIYGWDAYAWALLRAGRPGDAELAIDRALQLGTPDARIRYHAGMIALALGDEERARTELTAALRISPAFDPIHAPIAAQTLRELRS
jgi:tetratricopeptide (TPR) repeat protein